MGAQGGKIGGRGGAQEDRTRGSQHGPQGHTSEQDAVVSLLCGHPDGCSKPVHPSLPGAIERVLEDRKHERRGSGHPPWGSGFGMEGEEGSHVRGRGSPAARAAGAAAA